jgi:putative endonuclease
VAIHKNIKTHKTVKNPAIYIITNKKYGTLYVGVTSNLPQRIYQHKQGLIEGFSKKYDLKNLVYYEVFDDMTNAIEREKQIKAGNRKKKIELIELMNKEWKDLYDSIL